MASYACMHGITYADNKKRRSQLNVSCWWYNCILVFTGRIWIRGEYLKRSCAALSILYIGCIGTLTTQGDIRISKNLLHAALSI